MAKSNEWVIIFKDFHLGFAPLAHVDALTEMGNSGHASVMQNVDIISTPGKITQGNALSDLTNGTQAGVVSELINFIMDKAVADDVTYAIGPTKLFKISSTTVASGGTPSWPVTITNATDGESCIDLNGNLYYFYNKSSGSDCGKYDLSATFDHDWGSTTPTGAAALQKAPHPCATKEDIMAFGNGQYLGIYTAGNDTLAPTKLDFQSGNQVDDVIFHGNQWIITVNSDISGTNRTQGQIFLYDGSAVSTLLSDETAVGNFRIGWTYVLNGIIYVCYQDLSSDGGYQIGYISGRQIKSLVHFTGSLPTYEQKTLYKNTILFISNALAYSMGAVIGDLPIQISQIFDCGYATVGGIACPFGTPIVASSDGSTNHRLAKTSGFEATTCSWKSIIIPMVQGKSKAMIDEVVVLTKTLGANARCDIQFEFDQASGNSGTAKQITTTSKRRHIFQGFGSTFEDFRLYLNWANGNATNDCAIRSVEVKGHFVES